MTFDWAARLASAGSQAAARHESQASSRGDVRFTPVADTLSMVIHGSSWFTAPLFIQALSFYQSPWLRLVVQSTDPKTDILLYILKGMAPWLSWIPPSRP